MKTPIAKVRGLGSAGNGTHHWWMQKLLALALIPLTIWFVASVVQMTNADYRTVMTWMSSPVSATLMLIFMVTGIYHLKLGLQDVIEDYIPNEGLKFTLQIAISFGCILLAVVSVFSILKIAL